MVSLITPFPYRVKSAGAGSLEKEGKGSKYVRGSCLLMAKRFITGTVNAGVGL